VYKHWTAKKKEDNDALQGSLYGKEREKIESGTYFFDLSRLPDRERTGHVLGDRGRSSMGGTSLNHVNHIKGLCRGKKRI